MPSNKFQKIAKDIAKRDKEVFDELLEFEKTKRIDTKTRLNFTIDRTVASKFKKYCRNNGYNMSAKVEQAMRNIMVRNV